MAVPQEIGFYWAKWLTADEATRDGSVLAPARDWEVVYVCENRSDEGAVERFRVLVVGVESTQRIPNFAWGPGPLVTPAQRS
jgi:hypothetical protein